ncbi:hypothetical protein [Rhodococcus opacus]|uniref:hypothetical protein n=1 Tax=Rhodococcus opacus TaxID=37919 RepID=UPI002235F91E|nr:hypothetical protein [Rhodococcus opacus]UZG60512.1 hypothetical protein ONE62_38510 [Rhodococcus opacus]
MLLDDLYDPVIGAAVTRPSRGRSSLERACGGLAEAWTTVPEAGLGDVRTRMQIVTSHPRLRVRMWESTLATQEAIAEGLRSAGASGSK